MTMILDEGFVANWYVDLPAKMGNFMMGARRDESGEWDIQYRLRYYRDDKAFDSDDRKSWWVIGAPKLATVDQVLQIGRDLARKIQALGGGQIYELVREPGETMPHLMQRFREMPYANTKMAPGPIKDAIDKIIKGGSNR